MLLEPTFGYKSVWRVLRLFTEVPGKTLTRAELKELTRLGNESLTLALRALCLAGILIKTKQGRKEFYHLALENLHTREILELCKSEQAKLRMIGYETTTLLSEFARKALDRAKFIQQIILFGSVAKHTATKHSDIDVVIITSEQDTKQELAITEISDMLETKFKRNLQIHYFTQKEFNKSKAKLVKDIKRDGIDLLR